MIDTDKDAAAILNSQAMLNEVQYQDQFEQSIIDGDTVKTGDLHSAGTLRGVIDSAANIADNDAIKYGNLQDVDAYKSRGEWVDIAKTLGKEIPVVKDILDAYGKMPGDPIKEILYGEAPTADPAKPMTISSSDAIQRSVIQHLIDNNMGNPSEFVDKGLIDPDTGQIKPFHEIQDQGKMRDFRSAVDEYFKSVDPTVKDGVGRYGTGYRDTLPLPDAKLQQKEPDN